MLKSILQKKEQNIINLLVKRFISYLVTIKLSFGLFSLTRRLKIYPIKY